MRGLTALILLGTLVACASYAKSPTDGIYPDEITHPLPEDLTKFKQPASLVEDLKKLQSGSLAQRLKALADKSRRDQVFVKGGTFQMGDFGHLQSEEKLPWDGNSDSSPLHEVTLDSYSISRYKVTLAEFDLYAEVNKVASVQTEDIYETALASWQPWRKPSNPAGVTWEQAKAYCQWVGALTKQPFDLPTEAQWEYAARDRGKFIVYPTNNGKLEWNVNAPSYDLTGSINGGHAGWPFGIALFPPSPLGLYDLTINSLDWVEDWYDSDYYEVSDKTKNPRGPKQGSEKVQRSWPTSDSRAAMTMTRRAEPPGPQKRKNGAPKSTTFGGLRCVTHSTQPISGSKR